MTSLTTLLVDDDRAFGSLAAAALQREGFPVVFAHSLHEARAAVEQSTPELVILDRRLPDGDGLSLLPDLKANAPSTIVIMVTAYGDIASAVEAIRAGAADYIAKPVDLGDLLVRARRCAEQVGLRDRLHRAEAELLAHRRFIRPSSPAMRAVIAMGERIAATPRSSVLLLGETGSGKEILARHVHRLSGGEAAPFVHVNCAALPEPTVESELFGHEKGAFTDARTARRGLVEVANGGTLFLDEIAELPLGLQAKLLTFLDSGRFRRLGGSAEQTSTARIMAATNRNLEEQIGAGAFRQDLWFRLSVFRIDVPPLRERREDILPLAEGILADLCDELGKKASLGAQARERLLDYSFPGNVRELRNILERALVLESGPELAIPTLAEMRAPVSISNGPEFHIAGSPISAEEVEKRYARWVLDQLGGRRMEAAKALGLSYPTFLKRIEE